MLREKLSHVESDNHKLKEEITNLKAEIHKRRKLDDETTLLREAILDQHAKLYDIRMECFDKVKKMADKVKMIEEHLQQAGFQWSYPHENLFPRYLSQQQILFK